MKLAELVSALRATQGVKLKRDIARVAEHLPQQGEARWLAEHTATGIRNGDDAAAIPDGDGFVLLAAEGMLPAFVAADPWFAGFSALMVNVSDILAMGGRPYAVVDVLFSDEHSSCSALFAGMQAAARLFGVPVVGGHTSRVADGGQSLAVAIVGRARRLITSFDAKPGDDLIFAVDLRGSYRGEANYFDATSNADRERVRRAAEVLPALAEAGLVQAGKDVSMAGIAGTLAMLCEGSNVGAELELDALQRPEGTSLLRWLNTFPSYGFLLAVAPEHGRAVQQRFQAAGVTSERVGRFDSSCQVRLASAGETRTFWDVSAEPLTGFGLAREAGTTAPRSDISSQPH